MEISPLLVLEDPKIRAESMISIERPTTKTATAQSLLYIGTSDGNVLKYVLNVLRGSSYDRPESSPRNTLDILSKFEVEDPTRFRSGTVTQASKQSFDASFNHKAYLKAGKKPVTRMIVGNCGLVCLCEGKLVLVDPNTLDILESTESKMPPVTTFCFDDNGRIAAGTKSCVMILQCSSTNGIHTTPEMELPVPDVVLELACLDGLLVVGMKKEYIILQLATGQVVDQVSPIAFTDKWSGPLLRPMPEHGSVLLRLGPQCVFLKAEDVAYDTPWPSKRRIDWAEEPAALASCGAYCVAATMKHLLVYSVLDSDFCEPIQNLCLSPYRVVTQFSFCICVATGRDVHILTPIPFDRLLTRCVAELRVTDAINLFTRNYQGPEDLRALCLSSIYESAGFASFERLHFPQAFRYFEEAGLSPRDVLTLFPEFQSRSCTSMVAAKRPGLSLRTALEHARDESTEVSRMKALKCKQRLTEYLWTFRNQSPQNAADDVQIAIDYALLTILLEEYEGLSDVARKAKADALFLPYNSLVVTEVRPLLEQMKNDHLLILLHSTKGNVAEALAMAMSKGRFHHEAVLALQRTSEIPVISQHLPWIMDEDPDEGIKALLVKRSPSLSPDLVLSLIGSFPPDLLQLYLEHTIDVEGSIDTSVHTLLARIYIESLVVLEDLHVPRNIILKCNAGEEAGYYGELRRKLLSFLTDSDHYDTAIVLGALNLTQLHAERVIVYRKSGQHDSALRVLVYELKDLVEAEAYCVRHFEKQRAAEKKKKKSEEEIVSNDDLTQSETMADLREISEGESNPQEVHQGVYQHNEYLAILIVILLHGETPKTDVAVDLMTRNAHKLNALKILSIVPRTMSVSLLNPYLKACFGQLSHLRNRERIAAETITGDVAKHATFLAKLQARSVRVDDKRSCPVCGKKLADSLLAVFPNLQVCHFRCFKDKHIDPVKNVPFCGDVSRIN